MSQIVTEKMVVTELTKYGFKNKNGEYVNWSQKLKDSDKALVIPGVNAEFVLFVSDGGKKYVNEVKQVKFAPKEKDVIKTEDKKNDTPMTKSEWQAKDRSQLIGGLSHDAAVITASMVAVDSNLDPLEHYKMLLLGMLKIRDEIK